MNRLQEITNAFPEPSYQYGVCMISDLNQMSNISGYITFKRKEDICEIEGRIFNLPKGEYEVNINEYGHLIQTSESSSFKFNPFPNVTDSLYESGKKMGNLGKLVSKGEAETDFEFFSPFIYLDGEYSILGRSLVVSKIQYDITRADRRICHGVIALSDKF